MLKESTDHGLMLALTFEMKWSKTCGALSYLVKDANPNEIPVISRPKETDTRLCRR